MTVLRIDPTRTQTLRKQFMAAMKRRFKKVRKAVYDLIVKEDAFGLNRGDGTLKLNRWEFETDPEKLKQFQAWMKEQVNEGILELENGADPEEPWTNEYITNSYKKGIARGYTDTKPELADASDFYQGSKAQFLEDAFNAPTSVRQLQMLQTRAFEQLKGVTASMAADMGRVLADGFARGESPRKIAAAMAKGIDGITKKRALTIARTEIVYAHAEAQLDSFEMLGVEEIGVMAEWAVAGNACPLCSALEGTVMTVKEARGLLPRHPNCRCAWIPANVGEDGKGQKKGTEAKKAIDESTRRERPKSPLSETRERSSWKGADKGILGSTSSTAPFRQLVQEQTSLVSATEKKLLSETRNALGLDTKKEAKTMLKVVKDQSHRILGKTPTITTIRSKMKGFFKGMKNVSTKGLGKSAGKLQKIKEFAVSVWNKVKDSKIVQGLMGWWNSEGLLAKVLLAPIKGYLALLSKTIELAGAGLPSPLRLAGYWGSVGLSYALTPFAPWMSIPGVSDAMAVGTLLSMQVGLRLWKATQWLMRKSVKRGIIAESLAVGGTFDSAVAGNMNVALDKLAAVENPAAIVRAGSIDGWKNIKPPLAEAL